MDSSLTDAAKTFADVLERSETFLLSGHVNIDGDSLGSMLGMYYFLKHRGKKVRALCFEPLADRYEFMGGDAVVEIFDPDTHGDYARNVDVFMMFDFSATGRIPGLWDLVAEGTAFKVCLDHHRADALPGDLNVHDVTAPATGKVVLDLIRRVGGAIDKKIAEALMVAIATDTGWFRYSNTSAQVLRDASDLVAHGLEPSSIYQQIYQGNEVALIRLMGRVAGTLTEEMDGRFLWATIPLDLVNELGVGPFETDELLDLMRTGKKGECVALLRELGPREIRINLRSRGQVDVAALARRIGGGGHRHAAGATIEEPLAVAADRVVAMMREALLPLVQAGSSDRSRATGSGC